MIAPDRAVPRGMTHRFRPSVALGATSLIVSALLRVTLWWKFGVSDGVAAAELPSILVRGLVNDMVVSLYSLRRSQSTSVCSPIAGTGPASTVR